MIEGGIYPSLVVMDRVTIHFVIHLFAPLYVNPPFLFPLPHFPTTFKQDLYSAKDLLIALVRIFKEKGAEYNRFWRLLGP